MLSDLSMTNTLSDATWTMPTTTAILLMKMAMTQRNSGRSYIPETVFVSHD